ncbi:MAG: phosphotransferase family protein, partial [Erythrobacter sp.]|nr:phosphotransferase family protein [Erythrobacter sp.]
DLLLLLEEDAPEAERRRPLEEPITIGLGQGEADSGEIATAIAEWLAGLKDKLSGHDLFQLAVARNALGIVSRESRGVTLLEDSQLAADILSGATTSASTGLLARLRRDALDKLAVDVPKYPALAHARSKWTGEN